MAVLLVFGQDTDHGVDGGRDQALRFLHAGHGLLDLPLGRLVALGHGLGDRLRGVRHLDRTGAQLRAVQLQPGYDAGLFAVLDQRVPGDVVLAAAPPHVLDVAGFLEERDQLVVGDGIVHVDRHQRAPDLLDASRVVRDRQLRVRRQAVGRKHRVVGDDHLVGRHALDLVDDVRRQFRVGRVQAGHDARLVGDVQRPVLVRYVAHGRLVRRDDQRAVDEHGVGEVLGDGHAQRVEVLNVAYARLHRHRHVADLRVQSDVLDLADAPEQRLHLVLGGLRRDVRHLYHLGGAGRHGVRVRAGRHRSGGGLARLVYRTTRNPTTCSSGTRLRRCVRSRDEGRDERLTRYYGNRLGD